MKNKINPDELTFWEHLDELRGCLFKILIAVVTAAVAAFCEKEFLFNLVLAPKSSDFITYRVFERISGNLEPFNVELMNYNLAQQFMLHMKVSVYTGALIVSPYIIWVLMSFITPALYKNERKVAWGTIICGSIMFFLGVLVNYLLIFPLTLRFLGTYQVSEAVSNIISLESYIGTLLMLCFTMGIVFELPILSWMLGKIGLLKSNWMKKYRRHAILAILIISAVITPSGDAFTLLIVSLPIYLLYELSILVVKGIDKRRR